MKIAIIIPNYNGEKILRKNLQHVFTAAKFHIDEKKEDVSVIVVDDYSTDKSIEVLKEHKKQAIKQGIPFTFFQNSKNYGFSTTVNNGVRESDADLVILLNTDVNPDKDFIHHLRDLFSDEKVFAVGCMDKSIEDGKIVLRGRGIGRWTRGFLTHSPGDLDSTTTLWVSGGSSMFRKSIWVELGGMNELYNPFYWEDIDLSYRAVKKGYKVLFEKKSTVIHEHEEGSIKKSHSKHTVNVTAMRNQFIFVWTNISDINLLASHILWLPFYIFKSIFGSDKTLLKGFLKAVLLFGEISLARRASQSGVVKKDSEILSIFKSEYER